MDYIEIKGARLHNLKNIDLKIPKNKLVVITGVSGSGKSSLAFDILFEEGRNRYLSTIGMLPRLEKEKPFDILTGLSPTIGVNQRTVRYRNPRSTAGTRTGIYNYLRMFYAIEGIPSCPICQEPVNSKFECPICGMAQNKLEIKHFSFNEPSGMCLQCKGKGYISEFSLDLIIPDPGKTLEEICNDAPGSFKAMKAYEGIIPALERAIETSKGEYRRRRIESEFMKVRVCKECQGYRINGQARNVLIHGKHIGELAHLSINDLMT